MKRPLVHLALACLLVGLLNLVACKKEDEQVPITTDTTDLPTTDWPTTEMGPLTEPTSPIDLDSARSQGYVEDSWQGSGDSQSMNIHLVNKTESEFIVQVEEGTKLEPQNGDVQNMVVTHELDVHLHPQEEATAEVEVACLDISKDPPGESDNTWSAARSSKLTDFIACVNGFLDDVKRDDPDDADTLEEARSGLVQMALWKARGASRQQWIEFFVHYQQLTTEEAVQRADQLSPLLDETERRCGSLNV